MSQRTRIIVFRSTPGSDARDLAGSGGLVPFRAPHHSTSPGGCADECRLAVGGVLYLDEAPLFRREAIQRIGACLRHGSAHGPAIVAIDGRPLRPVGLGDEVLIDAAKRHAQRIAAIVADLTRDAAQFKPEGGPR